MSRGFGSTSQDDKICGYLPELPPDCGLQGNAGEPSHARKQLPISKPACSPALEGWVQEANQVFNGFIVSNNNSYTDEITNQYGYEHLYEAIRRKPDVRKIDEIKGLRGREARLIAHEFGFVRDRDIYEWFADLVHRQNNKGVSLRSPEGRQIMALNGRFCNRKGRRSIQVQKVFKEGIGEISDCILLTLTTHEKEVIKVMPENGNMTPCQFATCNIGSWVSGFINRFRQYQKVREIPWEFVGWTIEFQEGDEKLHKKDPLKMHNGFPHAHMIFRGKWIGKIHEIAKLWPYCADNGVDYMDKKKYEKKLRDQGKLAPGGHVSGIRLVNYVTAYVSKCSKAVVVRDGQVYVHKGYAWLAYTGGRMFNVAREYKRSGEVKKDCEKQEKTFQQKYQKKVLKGGWQYEGVQLLSSGEKRVDVPGVSDVGT